MRGSSTSWLLWRTGRRARWWEHPALSVFPLFPLTPYAHTPTSFKLNIVPIWSHTFQANPSSLPIRFTSIFSYFLSPILPSLPNNLNQALRYLWRVLDAEGTGRLTFETIGHFYKEVADILEEGMIEAPQIAHVKVHKRLLLLCTIAPSVVTMAGK